MPRKCQWHFPTTLASLFPVFIGHTYDATSLCSEYTPGIKETDYRGLDDAGINHSELAEILLQVYMQQIMVDGFFHADPHPGNVFARPGPYLILVDFGMVGRLTPRMRDSLRVVFVGIVRRDFEAVVAALVRLRFVRPGSDFGQVRRTVAWAVDSFYEMSFAELRLVEPREILDQTYDLLRAEAFQIPTSSRSSVGPSAPWEVCARVLIRASSSTRSRVHRGVS